MFRAPGSLNADDRSAGVRGMRLGGFFSRFFFVESDGAAADALVSAGVATGAGFACAGAWRRATRRCASIRNDPLARGTHPRTPGGGGSFRIQLQPPVRRTSYAVLRPAFRSQECTDALSRHTGQPYRDRYRAFVGRGCRSRYAVRSTKYVSSSYCSNAFHTSGSVAMDCARYCGRKPYSTTCPLPRDTSTIAALPPSFSAPRSQPLRSGLPAEAAG